MAGTLVDANVILDVVTEDEEWFDWSASMLERAAEQGPLAINPIVYAEVSIRFARIETLEDALPSDYFARTPLPWEAAFLASKCFDRSRRRQALTPAGFLHRRPCGRIGPDAPHA